MSLRGVRSDYLRSTVEALWPGASAHVTRRPGSGDECTWWILPSPRRPRMLVPVTVAHASTMLRRHDARRRDAIARRIIEAGVSTRALTMLPLPRLKVGDSAGIVEHLEALLGHPVRVGVLLGSDRANRKPVLRVFAADGGTVAFLKAAEGEVSSLVRAEADALQSIASAARSAAVLEVPQVLHCGEWNRMTLLLLSPLQASQSRGTDDDPELPAALEVACLMGLQRRSVMHLADQLRGRMASLPHTGELAAVRNHLDGLVERAGTRELSVGSWHGDWSPWNIGRHQGRLQAWDWERFASSAPVGYDAVHHRAQLLWRDHAVPEACRSALVGAARAMLELAGEAEADVESVVDLYLVEISLRYLEQQGSGDPPRPRTRWVLSQLESSSAPHKGST